MTTLTPFTSNCVGNKDENQINKQHPNYSKFKIFEYLSNALGDDIVLNFLINNKPKTSQSSIDGKHEIHIDDSDFTLWEVSFEISKNYEEEEYSFEEAKLDFLEKVGSDALEEEEDICNARIVFENGCIANVTASRLALKTDPDHRIALADAVIRHDLIPATLKPALGEVKSVM